MSLKQKALTLPLANLFSATDLAKGLGNGLLTSSSHLSPFLSYITFKQTATC